MGLKTRFSMLVLAAIGTTPAIEDRARPEFRPEISSKALAIPDEPVPLPRARPKISTVIPRPRPAPANVAATPTPVEEPIAVTSPKAGDVFMPIPPMPSPRP